MSEKKKVPLLPALLVAVLSFGGFVGVATLFSSNTSGLIPISFAKDGEDDGGDDGDKDEDKDEDKDDDKESKSEKKAKEEAKKKAERDRETAKKAAERSRESSDDTDEDDDMVNGVKVRGDGSVDDDGKDEDENEVEDMDDDSVTGRDDDMDDDNGMYKDRTKTLSKLDKELAEAEKDILEKQAEGVDVTAALARLAEAKAKAATVGGVFDSNDLEAAKQLSKEVKKLAHFASHDDLHDAKEVAEDVAKVAKRISQTNGKIALLEAVGGDSSPFKSTLASYESDLAALKATISAGGYDLGMMEDSLDALERKVKRLKSGIEGTIYALGGTDSELDDDLEDESDDISEHLNDVADIEDDSVGRAIRFIADDHKDATKKIGETVKEVDKRNPVLQALFGASDTDLNSLEQEIAANKTRTESLLKAAEAVEDQDMKSIILDQVEVLKAQTTKLQNFVEGQRDRLSLLGWFFNIGK